MENILKLISFLAIVFGLFQICNIRLKDFFHELSMLLTKHKEMSIKEMVLTAQGRKKKNYFSRQIEEAGNILYLHKKAELFPVVCGCSFLFAMAGVIFAFTIENYFLVPVLFLGLNLTPFIYVKFLGIQMTKNLNKELETALSVVTSSYVRSEDILGAVEENMQYINPPVKEIFQQFVMEAKLLNPDIKKLLRNMKDKVSNEVFREWCDAVISCQDDATLKTTLQPIVKKLSHVRVVTVELDNMLYAPVKEHVTMCLMVLANIPLMYFINKNWYDILVHHTLGKIVLAMNIAVIFISSIAVIKISQPIKYKR